MTEHTADLRREDALVAALAEALWDADARASGWRLDEARYADTTDRAKVEMIARAGTVLAALRHKGHTIERFR